MEGFSRIAASVQITSTVQKYGIAVAEIYAAKFKSNLEKLWWASSSVQASSELTKSCYGTYTARYLNFIKGFCPPPEYISLSDRINLVLSPPAFPSCGSCSPWHGYHTGQEQRGQYPLLYMSVSVSNVTDTES